MQVGHRSSISLRVPTLRFISSTVPHVRESNMPPRSVGPPMKYVSASNFVVKGHSSLVCRRQTPMKNIARCRLLVVGCWLLVVGCWLLLVVGCSLLVVGCSLLVVGRCSLFVVRCSLFVVRCSLFVVRWSLFVVRWSFAIRHSSMIRRWSVVRRSSSCVLSKDPVSERRLM